MKLSRKSVIYIAANFIVVLFLFISPYFIFDGKLFVGGDDTRLLYAYPFDFLKNWSFFSWSNVSSLSYFNPAHYYLPFLFVWSLLDNIIRNKIALDYLALSLPAVLGFIFFQKLANEIIGDYKAEIFAGSLFYIFSPILLVTQYSVFLIAAWLIGIIPLFLFLFLKYMRTGFFGYLYLSLILGIIFSFTFYAIPWIGGIILPLFVVMIIGYFIYDITNLFSILKRTLIYVSFLVLSQAFWLLPFLSSFIKSGSANLGQKALSADTGNTFAPTVNSTAIGNIYYPLLNLFHRQIVEVFDWQVLSQFRSFYDKLIFINFYYVIIFFLGLILVKGILSKKKLNNFLLVFVAFISSLYFFTVNLGLLKYIFLGMGSVPGMVMFRNFYDKFAIGYVLFYSLFITFCLVIVRKKYPRASTALITTFVIIVFVNLMPAKQIINNQLWKTNGVYKVMNFGNEYTDTINFIKKNISTSNMMLGLPFNDAAYAIITDGEKNAYVGTSPTQIFTGVSDITGGLSLPPGISGNFFSAIANRDYKYINSFLYSHNINYIFVTKNIPQNLLHSYFLSYELVKKQDDQFIKKITGEKIYQSSKGSYIIYKASKTNERIGPDNIYFQKINQTTYRLYIKGLKADQKVIFNDTYHPDWNLYLINNPSSDWCKKNINMRECKERFNFVSGNELFLLLKKTFVSNTHTTVNGFGNQWTINRNDLLKTLGKNYVKTNKDGSVDIELLLYFKRQSYVYLGVVVSVFTLISVTIFYLWKKR